MPLGLLRVSRLFHALLFVFYGLHGIINDLIDFKGVNETASLSYSFLAYF